MSNQTLGEFIIENQNAFKYSSGELSRILNSIRLAAKVVNHNVNKAGLVDIIGSIKQNNIQGEEQQKLDVLANEVFIQTLINREIVCGIASEENDTFMNVEGSNNENKNKLDAVAVKNNKGKFVVPSLKTVMDGSYNPLSRPLFIYLNASKAAFDPNVKKFIDFYLKYAAVLSTEVGYIPFSKSEYAAITKHYKSLKTGTAFKKPAIGLSVQQMLDLSSENQ